MSTTKETRLPPTRYVTITRGMIIWQVQENARGCVDEIMACLFGVRSRRSTVWAQPHDTDKHEILGSGSSHAARQWEIDSHKPIVITLLSII